MAMHESLWTGKARRCRLPSYARPEADKVFREKASGAQTNRAQLRRLLQPA